MFKRTFYPFPPFIYVPSIPTIIYVPPIKKNNNKKFTQARNSQIKKRSWSSWATEKF
jgi:hypothetical protein